MKISKLLLEAWTRTCKQALAVALAWVILFAPTVAAAQEKAQEQKATSTSQTSAPVSKSPAKAESGLTQSDRAGGPHEGIKVHGHWVIEILNSDGTLVSRSEFENALVPGNSEVALARLLGQPSKVSSWAIATNDGTANNGPCETSSGVPTPCVATPTLPLNPVTNLPNGTLVLKITATAKRNLTIRNVFTQLAMTDINGGAFLIVEPFTSKTLDPADQKTVVQDQVIQISVTFTFS